MPCMCVSLPFVHFYIQHFFFFSFFIYNFFFYIPCTSKSIHPSQDCSSCKITSFSSRLQTLHFQIIPRSHSRFQLYVLLNTPFDEYFSVSVWWFMCGCVFLYSTQKVTYHIFYIFYLVVFIILYTKSNISFIIFQNI